MRVLLLTNPRAGRGRGGAASRRIAEHLTARGHEVVGQEIAGVGCESVRADQLTGFDAVLVAGGDGTIHHLLPALICAQTPIYHLPLGTENLFAREFSMTLAPQRVAEAVEAGQTRAVDLGTCNGEPFALMCSLGPDANIVHRLVRRRRGPISHLSYLRPVLAEIARPGFVPLTVTIDGERVIDGRTGYLVVANCRQYGFRLDPARDASMTDGKLDVVFLPCRSSAGALRWAVRARMGTHDRDPRSIIRAGSTIEIEAGDPRGRFQMDGEAGTSPVRNDASLLKLGVRPGVLRVLMPADRGHCETLRPSRGTGPDRPDSSSDPRT